MSDWMDGLPDAPIIARSRHEPKVFAEIFERHFAVIHGYLQRRVGPGRADDLGADVFRIAFQQRARFEPLRESALPWLYGIATNLVHQDERSEIRRLRALARLEGQAVDAESTLERVAERADAESLRAPLFEALSGLEARDRTVLLLVAWEELTYEQVAEALEIPVGTVRSRLSRARTRVRQALNAPVHERSGSLRGVLGGTDAR
ncbi:MAG: RNA polymerase sigma factor [Gaiellaceae bacterium]